MKGPWLHALQTWPATLQHRHVKLGLWPCHLLRKFALQFLSLCLQLLFEQCLHFRFEESLTSFDPFLRKTRYISITIGGELSTSGQRQERVSLSDILHWRWIDGFHERSRRSVNERSNKWFRAFWFHSVHCHIHCSVYIPGVFSTKDLLWVQLLLLVMMLQGTCIATKKHLCRVFHIGPARISLPKLLLWQKRQRYSSV